MDRVLYVAMTGAKFTLGQQGAVANNLANVSTDGFRAEMHKLRGVEVISNAMPSRAFVVDATIANNFETGPLEHTGNVLDLAIKGKGWFVVQTPDGGEAYTRAGSLEMDQEGVLRTHSGLQIMGDGGPITIPPNVLVEIGADGTISAIDPDAGGVINVIDRVRVVNPDENNLERGDDGLFRTKDGAPAEVDENAYVVSGYVEKSNVKVVDQLVQMISLARQFEMQTKMITNAQRNDESAAKLLSAR